LSVTGVIVTLVMGVGMLCDTSTVAEFIVALPITFLYMLVGVAFIGYEGTGTPANMMINGGFYFFIVCTIVFSVLFVISLARTKKNSVRIQNPSKKV